MRLRDTEEKDEVFKESSEVDAIFAPRRCRKILSPDRLPLHGTHGNNHPAQTCRSKKSGRSVRAEYVKIRDEIHTRAAAALGEASILMFDLSVSL